MRRNRTPTELRQPLKGAQLRGRFAYAEWGLIVATTLIRCLASSTASAGVSLRLTSRST